MSVGSNSVNVFLGLGLPWVISVCYHAAMGTKFRVSSSNLSFSVLVYTSCGGCCLVILVLRRVVSCFLLLFISLHSRAVGFPSVPDGGRKEGRAGGRGGRGECTLFLSFQTTQPRMFIPCVIFTESKFRS
jgi:hypothetical protein